MKKFILISTFSALTVSTLVADDAVFASYDRDRDGSVTYAELGRAKKAEFDGLDRNRDNKLTEAEFAAAPEKKEDASVSPFDTPDFATLDADKDGVLSLSEFGTSIKNMIAALDTTSDDAVSKDEYAAAATAVVEEAGPSAGTEEKKGSAKKGSEPKKGSAPKTTES